jgi:hypothetical protein
MAEKAHTDTSSALPFGAKPIVLGASGFDDALAIRLAESGASDEAIEAAGGPDTAARMRAEATPRRSDGAAVATSSSR